VTAPVSVRLGGPGDAEALAEIFRRSIREVASRDYTPEQIAVWSGFADMEDVWRARMDARIVYVAEIGGVPCGFMQYEPPDHIDMSYVHPDFQRVGVASALLQALEAEAIRRGVEMLRVEVSLTARAFFAARGYALDASQIVHVRGMDFLNFRMWKRIA
jgi:putative acetyltransferase